MQYEEHIQSDLIGILSYNTDHSLIINTSHLTYPVVQNNRAIDGDTVYYKLVDGNAIIVGIVQRSIALKKIIGVLQITSTKIYGLTKRGVPIYNFVPLSWRYPNFLVSSNIKSKLNKPFRNVYTLIEFTEWTHTHPTGQCINVLGSITDSNAEDIALLHKNNIYIKKYQSLPDPIISLSTTHAYDLDCNIITIDPYGSTDLDDAIHIDDKHIYVHIADVDSIFHKDSPYEPHIKQRLSSVYAKNTYHMLPNGYGDDVLSLNQKGWKNTITIVLDHTLKGVEYHTSTIRVTKCMTYEQAQSILDFHDPNDSISNMINMLSTITGSSDTHKIIEHLMVATNDYIGDVTSAHGLSLLRVMDDVPMNIHIPNAVLEYLKFRSYTSAKYLAYMPDIKDVRHGALGKNKYVHFTSPIRRYSDLIIQRLLKDPSSYTYSQLVTIADQLNDHTRKIKRYYRDAAIMKLYHSITEPCTTDGYVVDYTSENNMVHIYLHNYNIEYRYPLFSDKLKHIISVTNTDRLLIVNHINQSWIIPKYESIKVDLSTNWTENRLNKKVIMRINNLSALFL
jgi:exoribonuclease R